MTTVAVKPGKIDIVRDLFAETNPTLVHDQPDWIEAKFTANRETNEVTVLAFWKNPDSYRAFSNSASFQQTMAQFADHFAGPPNVVINEVLLKM